MGAAPAHPPIADDERLLKTVNRMQLTSSDVGLFWQSFRKYDYDGMGTMSKQDFFLNICEQRKLDGELHNGLFDLCGIEDAESLDFGEFVQVVCTLAGFETRDMLRFCFFVFDKDKNGYLDKEELGFFVESIYDEKVPANITHALACLDYDENGRLYFPDFVKMSDKFPAVLYPIFHMQNNLRGAVCGTGWWRRRIALLTRDREEAEETKKEKEDREKKEAEEERRRAIIKRIGCIQYYVNRKKREEMEKLYAKGGGLKRVRSRLPRVKTLRSGKSPVSVMSSNRATNVTA